MKIQNVNDAAFAAYGRVVTGYDTEELLAVLTATTPAPTDSVVYVPSDAGLEATPAMADFTMNCYGGMPIQIAAGLHGQDSRYLQG